MHALQIALYQKEVLKPDSLVHGGHLGRVSEFAFVKGDQEGYTRAGIGCGVIVLEAGGALARVSAVPAVSTVHTAVHSRYAGAGASNNGGAAAERSVSAVVDAYEARSGARAKWS